ncbi:hypothetical protein EC991_001716 [Linnemannia zychae]|nr:hypothetical protein EC991_001716 [Linnemannia zychae]
MAAPCALASIWKTCIQQPAIVLLESLLAQVQVARHSDPFFSIPTIEVYKSCFRPDQQGHAVTMLGIDFSAECESLSLTVLQYSLLSLYSGLPEDVGQRELVIEMVVRTSPSDEITNSLFEHDNNALHLAAFLKMESTLQLLIAYGGDPHHKNGRGLSAFDILFSVMATSLPVLQAQGSISNSVRNNVTSATLATAAVTPIQNDHALVGDGEHLSVSFKPCTSTAAIERGANNHNGDGDGHDEEASGRSTAHLECDNDSLELCLDDGPQVLQLIHQDDNRMLDSPDSGDLFVCNNNRAVTDRYSHGDLDNFRGNNAHLGERDAQNLDPHYYYQDDLRCQYHLREQQELEKYGITDSQLHDDLTCFLRIQPCEPNLDVNGQPLVSILKNRQAWRPMELSRKHAESFGAYEAYTDRLQLQRKPGTPVTYGHYDKSEHEKWVQWSRTKVVRVYQRHMNNQLETDDWDCPHVSEPFYEPVEDTFVSTASPYDMVRPVTPLRTRSNPFGMNHNSSCIDLLNDATLDRAFSPQPQGVLRPLPEIPHPTEDLAKFSSISHRRGAPPPPLFLCKSPAYIADITTAVTTQVDESVKSSSAHFFPKRLSATSLLWSSKLPNSSLSKMSFSANEVQIRSPMLHPSSDAAYSGSPTLEQQHSAGLLSPLVSDSSPWVPRMLRNLTSPSSSLSKAKNRTSTDLSQSISMSPLVEDLIVQDTPFAFTSDTADRDGYPSDISSTITFGTRDYAKEYDSITSISHLSPASSVSTTVTTTSTFKVLSQIKSAIREKFSAPPHVASPIPHSQSTRLLISTSRSISESPSPTQSASSHGNGPYDPLAIDSSFNLSNSNSSDDNDTSGNDEDENDSHKTRTIMQQRQLAVSVITGDQFDAIRAYTPLVTLPLAQISCSRSTTRSSQLHSPTKVGMVSDTENLSEVAGENEQNGSSGFGLEAYSTLSQDSQAFSSTASHHMSFASATKHISDATVSAASTSHFAAQDTQEDLNRPTLPERSSSQSDSSSFSSALSRKAGCAESLGAFTPQYKTNATSFTRLSNWKKRKDVAMILSSRTLSPPHGSPSPLPVGEEQDHGLSMEELAVEEFPVHHAYKNVKPQAAEISEDSVPLSTESTPAQCSTFAVFTLVHQNDAHLKNYKDIVVESTEITNKAKSLYTLPELTFSVSSLAEMEYVHGVTHTTCSALFEGTQDTIKSSSLRAALVNIQGIGHGLEIQKYKLRQTAVVQRYSDVDATPSTSSPLAVGFVVTQPSQQERRVSSFWMDAAEFDSQPHRLTLSNCDSPSTTMTGVLYLRLKKVCNFSLPLPEENTMISIRIDTGYEKVDTDYVPLEDIDMIFNQEFCLPVCPDLAITITLHLMQAPHLQPRHQQQQPLHIAGSSSLSLAIVSNDGYTLEGASLDRPYLVLPSPNVTKSLPAIPQQQVHHTPATTSLFRSIGKNSIMSSLFLKRNQSSLSQFLLDENSIFVTPAAATVGTSLFGSISRQSAPTLSAASAPSRPWVGSNSSSSSSSPMIGSSKSASSSPTSNSPTPSEIAAHLLQHSPSSSAASSSTSPTNSESSLSTIPSSCDESSELGGSCVFENDRRKNSGNSTSTFARWKSILSVGKKHRFTQRHESKQPSTVHSRSGTTTAVGSSFSTSSAIPAMQQQVPVDQDQWQAYWKVLGEQHQKGLNGLSHGRSLLSHRSLSTQNNAGNSSTTNTPNQHNHSAQHVDTENPIFAPTISTTSNTCTPAPFLPQLTLAQIHATESPLEILNRYILFDDELCIARTGIVFNEIQASCTNQIVNVEFHTVNNWVDLNDYSRIRRQDEKEFLSQNAMTCPSPVSDNEGENRGKDGDDDDEDEEGLARNAMIANIQTTVCFIPGPEMDPEDAIFEEHDRVYQEPQNLVDCHVGLKYFHWQSQLSFCGELFYQEEQVAGRPVKWRQGKFCIIGSVFWQLCPRVSRESDDENEQDERWRCLDLSLVYGIETSHGRIDARARYLVEAEEFDDPKQHQQCQQQKSCVRIKDTTREYYPVRNGFRLCMAKNEETEDEPEDEEQRFEVEFYSESPEQGQQWVSALIEACRERPPRPYWLN